MLIKKNLTNQKVLHTYKKGLPPYKRDLLTYTKKDSLIYTKTPLQIATANSQIRNTEDRMEQSSVWESFTCEEKKKQVANKAKAMRINLIN